MGDRSWSLKACEHALGTELWENFGACKADSQTGLAVPCPAEAVQAKQEVTQEDSRRVEPLGASEEPSLQSSLPSSHYPQG